MKRAGSLLAVSLLILACKSATPDTAQVQDFNSGANPTLSIPFDNNYSFCPAATRFNIVNAYWLTLADAYVYATQDVLQTVAQQIQTQWTTLKTDFISSPDSSNPADPSIQALWIETDAAAVLAFRGTPLDRIDVQDIVSDVNAVLVPFDGGGNVHQGFKTALDSVWAQVSAHLMALQGTNKPLFLTGHSLGGALATLTAARMVTSDPLKSAVASNLKGLYTIGSPMLGDATFVSTVTAALGSVPVVRIRNHDDIVTRVPGDPFQHLGPLYYLTDDGRFYTQDQSLSFARYQMPDAVAATIVNGFTVAQFANLTDHLPTNYFAKLSAEYMLRKTWAKQKNADICAEDAYYQMPEVQDVGIAPGINKLEDLKGLNNAQLTDLYSKGINLPIPSVSTPGTTADGQGLPLIMPGDIQLNDFAYNFWEGKRFTTDPGTGQTTLVNKLASNWIDDISASVHAVNPGDSDYVDPGDGKGYILLDYSTSNIVAARLIRDEIRNVAPGLYLGRANLQNPSFLAPIVGQYQFVIWFALGFGQAAPH